MDDVWQVYLLQCADGTYYCGVTKDVNRRLRQHNGQMAGGARYTAARRPVVLLVTVPTSSRSSALHLEWVIKKLSRKDKLGALRRLGQNFADI